MKTVKLKFKNKDAANKVLELIVHPDDVRLVSTMYHSFYEGDQIECFQDDVPLSSLG